MFVMENPAGGNYDYVTDTPPKHKNDNVYKYFSDEDKSPTVSWYWLDGSYLDGDENYNSLDYVKCGAYGKAVYSIMKTFRIANGYLTNMVKCGIGKKCGGSYQYNNTDKYTKDIIKKCIEERLIKEIDVLRGDSGKVLIFAFGDRTKKYLDIYLKNNDELQSKYNLEVQIEELPHPRRRISNEERRKLIYDTVSNVLSDNDFYSKD
jgi:hypothetical protein